MAIKRVGVYPKWLDAVPKDENGRNIPKSQWLRKRRHHWVVRWYSTSGKKRYGKVFETKREAERYASELQNRVNLGRSDRLPKITLHDFRREYQKVMKGQVADTTLSDHIRALRFFENFIGGSILLQNIKPGHAEAFIAHRLSTVPSIATVNKDIRTLRGIFNVAIKLRGYVPEGQNPFARVKERKATENEIRYVTVEEYQRLVKAAGNIWWQTLFSIASGSGLRRSEILSLTWADIDFEDHRIKVAAKKNARGIIRWEPKGRKNRIVPMSDESSQLLVDMQAKATEGHPYVFVSPERLGRIKGRQKAGSWNAGSAVVNNMNRDFDAIRCRANVAKCTLHDLRRSAITNWAKRLPIQVVQVLAGHSNIATTRKYYRAVRPEDMDSASRITNEILESANTD